MLQAIARDTDAYDVIVVGSGATGGVAVLAVGSGRPEDLRPRGRADGL